MTKVKLPEPVARQIRYYDSNILSMTYEQWLEWQHFDGRYARAGAYEHRDLITTAQAEAYAVAKVREALEALLSVAWELGVCANDIRAMLPNNTTTE